MAANSIYLPLRELMKFGIVGGLATVIHASVGLSAVVWFGMSGGTANVIGFASAWWVSFLGHQTFTFAGRADYDRALLRFIVHSVTLFLIAFAITTALTTVFTGLSDGFVPVLAACIVPVLSFLSSKFFVFRSSK